ncbi:hypothetical protein CEK26_010659 [Fusarium fujikuroi]|uniref:Uncharacterized protein n=1 Tax=Fusarium fujikuroi TaxID=5127 RepID=A0A5Q3G494_FUSFU|nr:hypothetical protein CEK27_010673 [Fusarium fujikuroi]QGI83940.1 hypothetical protein CEK25_010669 [Fusarium fujikuroi]QGI97590.1 hypothetical protein CEK26_010659 [Fusarium fujikuroi]VTT74534.1 unnamed protein product [Fusarium fujikuroi]VZH97463.1 unnamed protein product [Fusarium fujikuroi]
MEPVGIILLVLFLFIIIMGPLMSVRRASEKVFNPQPNQLDNARRKLSTVTTSTVIPQANPDPTADIEAQTPLSGFVHPLPAKVSEAQSPLSCSRSELVRAAPGSDILSPICIGPLVPEPVHTVNADPRPILEKVSTVTSHETNDKPGPSVQTTDKSGPSVQTTAGPSVHTDEAEDDIMTINACGHSFHSKCLSSWFLIERYDCPVCRVPYYKGMSRRETALSVTPFW